MSVRSTAILVAALLLFVASNAMFVTNPAQRALVFRFGQIVAEYDAPGLHFKWPFVENVQFFDGRLLTLDDQVQTVTTAGNHELKVTYYAKWRIADLPTYYRATGGQEIQAVDRLSTLIDRGVADVFSKLDLPSATAARSASLLQDLGADTRAQIKSLGIDLVDLRIRDLSLPKDLVQNAYDRMRAERQRIASDLRAQGRQTADQIKADADSKAAQVLADAQRQADKIRGEGDAKAAQIYARAYSRDPEFFRFYRSLDAYRKALGSGGGVLVLRPDSEFFRYFRDQRKH